MFMKIYLLESVSVVLYFNESSAFNFLQVSVLESISLDFYFNERPPYNLLKFRSVRAGPFPSDIQGNLMLNAAANSAVWLSSDSYVIELSVSEHKTFQLTLNRYYVTVQCTFVQNVCENRSSASESFQFNFFVQHS
jgi:hypothetical protein